MTILTNARIVLADEVIHGTVVLEDDRIRDVQPGRSNIPGATDLKGDVLMPGVVDVHTDNLERQVQPRSNALRGPGAVCHSQTKATMPSTASGSQ